jgi:hypothetical protein
MEYQEELVDSIIEEIAALLATGYLRLRKARTRRGPAEPPAFQTAGERLDGTPCLRRQGAMSVTPNEKGDSP